MIPKSLPARRRTTARAVIEYLHDGTIVKRFKSPGTARAEVRWYLQLEELGITPRAVSMRLYRALERLSAELARRG